jgi:hypothetical protein
MILKLNRVETLCIIIGIALLMFLAYLFKLNYYSWFSYPWSIPIQKFDNLSTCLDNKKNLN